MRRGKRDELSYKGKSGAHVGRDTALGAYFLPVKDDRSAESDSTTRFTLGV